MRWYYEGSGKWNANSKFGDNHLYRINVNPSGLFTLNETDKELVDTARIFETLDSAKNFCFGNENDLEVERNP